MNPKNIGAVRQRRHQHSSEKLSRIQQNRHEVNTEIRSETGRRCGQMSHVQCRLPTPPLTNSKHDGVENRISFCISFRIGKQSNWDNVPSPTCLASKEKCSHTSREQWLRGADAPNLWDPPRLPAYVQKIAPDLFEMVKTHTILDFIKKLVFTIVFTLVYLILCCS